MPTPTTPTYSAAAKVAAQTAFRDLIDSGSGAGFVRVKNAADVLLSQITLADPCGTVNGTTGLLTFTLPLSDAAANANGTAAYAEFCDSDGDVHLALPCAVGTAAASGYFVMQTLTVVAGGPVTILGATIG